MQKDYYKILQLPSHANLTEIKQAYRKLALLHHPDKNNGDPYAGVKFGEIKEAYEVLSNPARKELYLQERWYNQSTGRKRHAEAITPVSILRLSLELEKYVSTLDVHRMNKEGLASYIAELLSSDTIAILRQFDNKDINRQIVSTLLTASKSLPLKIAKPLIRNFEMLAAGDEVSTLRVKKFSATLQKIFLWDRYKFVLIFLITALICLLIYLTNR